MKEQFETMASDHLRVALAFCAFIIALLTVLTVIKKRQQGTLQFNDRGILWTVAIFMLEATMLCVALGILSPSMHNSPQLLTCILGFVIPGLLAYSAEKIHKSTQTRISEENNHEQVKVEPFTESSDDPEKTDISEETAIAEGAKHVVFTARLNTTLANRIFTKAIKEGYIEEVDGHYKRKNMSKALLTYMCGRIYCGDKSKRIGETTEYAWKQGKGIFPETDLNKLFGENGLAQARYNRVGTAVPLGFEAIDKLFE